jgi:hypothetical protein
LYDTRPILGCDFPITNGFGVSLATTFATTSVQLAVVSRACSVRHIVVGLAEPVLFRSLLNVAVAAEHLALYQFAFTPRP